MRAFQCVDCLATLDLNDVQMGLPLCVGCRQIAIDESEAAHRAVSEDESGFCYACGNRTLRRETVLDESNIRQLMWYCGCYERDGCED